jgi:hypothetical protein
MRATGRLIGAATGLSHTSSGAILPMHPHAASMPRRCSRSLYAAEGDRTTVFEFGGLRDRQRDYIDWVLKASLDE